MAGAIGAIVGAAGGMSSGAAQGLAGLLATKDARQWERHMRQTAYQDTVRDLYKSGLNPALAYSQGPTGSHAAAPVPIPDIGGMMMEGAEMGMATAKQGKAMADELGTIKAQRESAETNAENLRLMQGEVVQKPRLENDLMRVDFMKRLAEINLMGQQEKESVARTVQTDVNRFLLETELPGARAQGAFDATEHGELMRKVRRALDLIPGLGGGFRSSTRR